MSVILRAILGLCLSLSLVASCSGGDDDDDLPPATNDDDADATSTDDDDSVPDDDDDDDDTTQPEIIERVLTLGDGIRFIWNETEDSPLNPTVALVEGHPAGWDEERQSLLLAPMVEGTPSGLAFPEGARWEITPAAGYRPALDGLLANAVAEIKSGGVENLADTWDGQDMFVIPVEHFTSFAILLSGGALEKAVGNGDAEVTAFLRASAGAGGQWAVGILLSITCGNGTVDAFETCDGHESCDDGCYAGIRLCSSDCMTLEETCLNGEQGCGNGFLEGCEVCDDGDNDPCTADCNTDCTGPGSTPVCGDGVIQCGEVCDDGDTDACTPACDADCTGPGLEAVCGNGTVECAESCDEGGLNGQPGHCNASCDGQVATACGNGVTEPGEACDGETGVPCVDEASGYAGGQKCKDDCTGMSECFLFESCGDGKVNGHEICDAASPCCESACDALKSAGAVCRTAGGVCDLAETCDGTSAACPADQKSTAVCRPSTSACDTAENCNGASNTCPADDPSCSDAECQSDACLCVSGACKVSFAADVLPIFTNPAVNPNACTNCHGGTNNLFLDSHAGVMSGTSFNGPVIIPGDPDNSILYRKVNCWGQTGYCLNDEPMPFGGPPLSAEQIQIIHDWINQGALDN